MLQIESLQVWAANFRSALQLCVAIDFDLDIPEFASVVWSERTSNESLCQYFDFKQILHLWNLILNKFFEEVKYLIKKSHENLC